MRYGLRPFRHQRMHRQSIMIKAPNSFVEQVLWPEFQELNAALAAYLSEITEKVIREEVHGESGEAEEIERVGNDRAMIMGKGGEPSEYGCKGLSCG